MTRRSLFAFAAGLLLAAAAWAVWWWRPPAVPVMAVQSGPLVRSLVFSARVAALFRVDVGSTITGRVSTVAVPEGATVRRGDVLLRLETAELDAAVAQAQASEQQAAARLAGLRSSGRRGAQAAVAQADSVALAAQADLQRTQQLVAQGFLSPSRLDEARRALDVALAQQAAAAAQRAANAESGTDIAQAQAQLALARAATVAAQARQAQAVVTAPSDGRVLLRTVEPGQIVQPGRALLTLALAGPTRLLGQVDERYLDQLQPGQTARVLADAYPGQPFAARVDRLAPLVDAQRGALEVRFSLPQAPPAFLREDMTLSVEVETGRRERALAVPAQALANERAAAAATVQVLRDGRIETRAVRLGLRTLDAAEVLDGLAEGDLVVIGPAPAPGARARADLRPPAVRPPPGDSAAAALSGAMGR